MSDPMAHPIPHPIPHGFRDRREGRREKGEDERGEGNVDPSTTSPHCPTGDVSRTCLHSRAREFEHWLVYEDEKEAIRAEAVLLQKRLHQLRRRWQSIVAAQADEQEAA